MAPPFTDGEKVMSEIDTDNPGGGTAGRLHSAGGSHTF